MGIRLPLHRTDEGARRLVRQNFSWIKNAAGEMNVSGSASRLRGLGCFRLIDRLCGTCPSGEPSARRPDQLHG